MAVYKTVYCDVSSFFLLLQDSPGLRSVASDISYNRYNKTNTPA